MGQITYEYYDGTSKYQSPYQPNKTASYDVKLADLVRYSVTSGGFSYRKVSRQGRPFYRDLIKFAVDELPSGNGFISRDDYACAETSIASAVSFFIGMVSARAYAEKVLHCPHLYHLNDRRIDVKPDKGQHPDFYGESRTKRFLLEAKGTKSKRVSKGTILDAKKQLTCISSVNGASASGFEKYVVATSFQPQKEGHTLTQSIVDPTATGDENISFDIDKAAYYYYEGITSLFDDPTLKQERFDSHPDYVFVTLDDYMIGISDDVLAMVQSANPASPTLLHANLNVLLEDQSLSLERASSLGPAKAKHLEQYSAGGDGIILELLS